MGSPEYTDKYRREIADCISPPAGPSPWRPGSWGYADAPPTRASGRPSPEGAPIPGSARWGRDFTSPVPACKLVGDITCLRTGEGWLFPSIAIDLNTRMVVGWSPSDRMAADIAVDSPSMAKARGCVAGNAIFRGAQYTSRFLTEWAKADDVRLSCSRTGNRHDNAAAESSFATLENKMHYRESFATRADARHAVEGLIESHCNRRRPHSSIGYRIPGPVMDDFFRRTAPGPESLPIAA